MITLDELATFCKRKGFVYPSAEIYGGLAGFWDFGPLGVELKKHLKDAWWNAHVYQRDDVVGIDGSLITHPKVWEASGHVASFSDVYVRCLKCKKPNKLDKNEVEKALCPHCGGKYEVLGNLNLMFKTQVGPVGQGVTAYLRPETAQLIFADFKLVQEHSRMQLPFGIAQLGKAFRNEISPREFIFRCREFELMELEYFIASGMKCPYLDEIADVEMDILSEELQKNNGKPKHMNLLNAFKKGIFKKDWHVYWLAKEYQWFVNLGAKPEHFRARQHTTDERSHYSSDTWDLEYAFPLGWRELQGFADRSTYDLSQHQKHSGKSLEMHDSVLGKVLPEVVCEPALGVERAFLVFLLEAYEEDKKRENVILHLHPRLAPVKAAIFPIVKDEKMITLAKNLAMDLRTEWNVYYDESGSVGRRYARNDEIGTPLCITVDEQTLKEKSVTLRDRDSTKQVRVPLKEVVEVVRKVIQGENVLKLGKVVETRVKGE